MPITITLHILGCTVFNQDFSKIDAGFFWLEGALARSGYEVLQARLAEESKGIVPLGRGMLFDSFRSGERVSLSGGLGMRSGGGLLLDTGTGTVDKVHVAGGRLDHAVNEVWEDGSCSMMAYVHICGRVYAVRGDVLAPAGDAGEEGDDLHKSAGPTGAVR